MKNHPKSIVFPAGSSPESVFQGPLRRELEPLLPDYLRGCRWFGGKARQIRSVRVGDPVPLRGGGATAYLYILAVSYRDGDAERYLLPLSFHQGEPAAGSEQSPAFPVLARLTLGEEKGILFDAVYDPRFRKNCFRLMAGKDSERQGPFQLRGIPGEALRQWFGEGHCLPQTELLDKEQSNTSFSYGKDFIFKLYRRLAVGGHPEVEMSRFLTEEAGFPHVAPFAGLLELETEGAGTAAIGLLQAYVPHQDDAWNYSLRAVAAYLRAESPEEEKKCLQGYSPSAALIGTRTAQLHQALAAAPDNPDFAPRPFTPGDREELSTSIRSLLDRTLTTLRSAVDELPPETAREARPLLRGGAVEKNLAEKINLFRPGGMVTRIHGDYHLGQLLHTEKDFVIIDFEGEPARPLEERRRKRSPLVDVAGMIRSLHYAAYGAIFLQPEPETGEITSPTSRAEKWYRIMSDRFLSSYLREMGGKAAVLLGSEDTRKELLDLCILEKAVYELNYELNNRPAWAIIPLNGLRGMVGNRG